MHMHTLALHTPSWPREYVDLISLSIKFPTFFPDAALRIKSCHDKKRSDVGLSVPSVSNKIWQSGIGSLANGQSGKLGVQASQTARTWLGKYYSSSIRLNFKFKSSSFRLFEWISLIELMGGKAQSVFELSKLLASLIECFTYLWVQLAYTCTILHTSRLEFELKSSSWAWAMYRDLISVVDLTKVLLSYTIGGIIRQ